MMTGPACVACGWDAYGGHIHDPSEDGPRDGCCIHTCGIPGVYSKLLPAIEPRYIRTRRAAIIRAQLQAERGRMS